MKEVKVENELFVYSCVMWECYLIDSLLMFDI